MGTMGLALPWRARISSTQRERGTRVEPSEHLADGPNPAARDALSEDAALAAGCRSGDLRAYERLYTVHGARMKNLARNVLGNATDAEDAVQETFLKVQRGVASFRGQTRHQRDVFLLYEVEGFRHAEIAGMLEMTETASKNTLFQAKKNLRLMLEPPRSSAAESR